MRRLREATKESAEDTVGVEVAESSDTGDKKSNRCLIYEQCRRMLEMFSCLSLESILLWQLRRMRTPHGGQLGIATDL